MGNLLSIYSVGNSLVTYLRNSYPETLRNEHACDFRLLSSGEMVDVSNIGTALSLYLYRVSIDEHLRNTSRHGVLNEHNIPLAVDLHYLLTVWADSALAEHSILAWAMRQLYMYPILDRSALTPEANWEAEDIIHIIPSELSNEDMMRIWDALIPPYHLSVSYVARVVRIDIEPLPDSLPVVAKRFSYSQIRS
jgi:hypothetical protein